MEEAKGMVKRALLLKFKDDFAPDQIEQLIKDQYNLVNLVEPLKSFHWGRSVINEYSPQGFTHVFEFTFEGTDGPAAYMDHPTHVEFASKYRPYVDNYVLVDYKPTILRT